SLIPHKATASFPPRIRGTELKERHTSFHENFLLHIHDTIEVFSESLEELRNIFQTDVAPKLHPRRRAELEGTADELFGKVDDTIREASRMAAGRKLSPERLAESSRAGLGEIFRSYNTHDSETRDAKLEEISEPRASAEPFQSRAVG